MAEPDACKPLEFSAMDKTFYSILTVLLCCSLGCAQTTGPTNLTAAEVSHLRELYIERANETRGWKDRNDPRLSELADAFYDATVGAARRRNRVEFVVLDEAGEPIPDVDIEFRVVTHSVPLAWEPNIAREKRRASGVIRKDWPVKSFSIEVDVSKRGYRAVNWSLSEKRDNDRFKWSQYAILRGFLLPPKVEGEPLRVILPPALQWEPEGAGSDDFTPGSIDPARYPEHLARDANPVVTSDAPGTIHVAKRGTYALIDKDGKVLSMRQADPGNWLYISASFIDVEHEIGYFGGSMGGSSRLKPANPPYQWQFFAAPRPRADPPAE